VSTAELFPTLMQTSACALYLEIQMNKLLATLVFACVSTAAMAQAGTTAAPAGTTTTTAPASDTTAPAAKPEHKDHKKHKAEHATSKAAKDKKADAAAEGTGMTAPAEKDAAYKSEGKAMHGKHKSDAAAPAGTTSTAPGAATLPATK
jgi:competence protein ComEA